MRQNGIRDITEKKTEKQKQFFIQKNLITWVALDVFDQH